MEYTTEDPTHATPENTRVIASNYACMAITMIVLGARAWKCVIWRRKIGLDDITLFLALLAAIVESALTEYAVKRGLGTFIRPGNSARLQSVSELMYASDLVFLIAMFFAKISLVRLVYRIASARAISKGKLFYLQLSIGLWVLFSVPAIAFQCGMPHPWLYSPSRCFGSGSLWYPTLILNVLTDAWLAVSIWTALPDMSVSAKDRQVMLGLFSSRFVVCILCVVQIALLSPALRNENQTRALPNPTVLRQIVMDASILSAGIPVLYRALAVYVKSSSVTTEVITNDKATTPLGDLQRPVPVKTSDRQESSAFAKESSAPTLGNQDFSTRFSIAFHKEVSNDNKV